jgi:hypothetical protein
MVHIWPRAARATRHVAVDAVSVGESEVVAHGILEAGLVQREYSKSLGTPTIPVLPTQMAGSGMLGPVTLVSRHPAKPPFDRHDLCHNFCQMRPINVGAATSKSVKLAYAEPRPTTFKRANDPWAVAADTNRPHVRYTLIT